MRIKHYLLSTLMLISCGTTTDTLLVEPMPDPAFQSQQQEVVYPASFLRSDINWETQSLTFEPYSMDRYGEEAIHSLKPGDRFLFDGDTLTVETVVYDDGEVLINQGLEEGGATLRRAPEGYYRGLIWNDHATYTAHPCVTLPFAASWTLYDCGDDPSDPTLEITAEHESYLSQLPDYRDSFTPLNTLVTVRDGQIVAITRRWIP